MTIDAFSFLSLVAVLILAFIAAASIFILKKAWGVVRLWRQNSQKIDALRRKIQSSDAAEARAWSAVLAQCQQLQSRWILNETDLDILTNTRRLALNIAAGFHPDSPAPEKEVRIGRLLEGFLEMQTRLLVVAEMDGLRPLAQFRLRHVFYLSRAWKAKQDLQRSKAGRFFEKYKLFFIVKWVWTLYRFLDLGFWLVKMAAYVGYDVTFKIFLMRWYLLAGELAVDVYRERGGGMKSDEDILAGLSPLDEPDGAGPLPPEISDIVARSKKEILLDASWTLEWERAREIYVRLVEDVAGYHHPESEDPLKEAKVFDLITGAARFAEEIAALKSKPVLNKLLDLRLSHLWAVKDAADYFSDAKVVEWIRKYHLHHAVKYSRLIYKVVAKRHPGILFKDFAFQLAGEGLKRWFYIYLHGRVAREANLIYRPER